MRMFMLELLFILLLINPVAALLALAVVAVLAAIYYAAKLIIALAASLIASLVAAMIAAAVIVATVIMAIVASVVAMVVATAQFIGNVPTYVSDVCSYVAQSVGSAAYFVASFFRMQETEVVVHASINDDSTLPLADAYLIYPRAQYSPPSTRPRSSLRFFDLPEASVPYVPSAPPIALLAEMS